MISSPSVIVFDVNETLSDMSRMGTYFSEVGAPDYVAKLWFATLLRDGFALTASGENGSFAAIGADILRELLRGLDLDRSLEAAVDHVMAGMSGLELHPDVSEGVRTLSSAGFRLVTLSNGSTEIAEKLFKEAKIREKFERILSVEDAPGWKPARSSYDYAAAAIDTDPADMVLVAVHPWDVHGAARAGLDTVWLNRNDEHYPKHFAAPDFTVKTLTELRAALRARS